MGGMMRELGFRIGIINQNHLAVKSKIIHYIAILIQ